MKTQKCPQCDVKYFDEHTELQCMQIQLNVAQIEIKKLKKSVDDWKDSWYYQRTIIGELCWRNNLDIYKSWIRKENLNEESK